MACQCLQSLLTYRPLQICKSTFCSPTWPINFHSNPVDFCKCLLGNQCSHPPSIMNTLSLPLLRFLKTNTCQKHSQSPLRNRLFLVIGFWKSPPMVCTIGFQIKGSFHISLFFGPQHDFVYPTWVCIFPFAICIHAPFRAMFKHTKQKQKSSTAVQLQRLHVICSYFKGGSSCSIVAF